MYTLVLKKIISEAYFSFILVLQSYKVLHIALIRFSMMSHSLQFLLTFFIEGQFDDPNKQVRFVDCFMRNWFPNRFMAKNLLYILPF